MPFTDLVIIADGSFDGSDATAGVGFRILGQGFVYEGGAAFSRQVCRSSIEAEIAAILRGMITAYRILAKNEEGLVANTVTVRCDCASAIRFMNGDRVKGIAPELIGLRDRVVSWFRGENYALVFSHLKAPVARNLREITAAQYILMDVDKVAKTYAGYHRYSPKRELMDDIAFKEPFKLEACHHYDAPTLKRIALC